MSLLFKFIKLITNQFKVFLTPPVFVFTNEDYAETIIKGINNVHLIQTHKISVNENISTIIARFNHQWLQGTLELERIKEQIPNMVANDSIWWQITKCIEQTKHRMTNFNHYIGTLISELSLADTGLLHTEMELIRDMNESLVDRLKEKEQSMLAIGDRNELISAIVQEVEASLDWLDRIHDAGMMKFCDMLGINVPKLNKTRHEISEYLSEVSDNLDREVVASEMEDITKKLKGMMRSGENHELEIGKVMDKICSLEKRIAQLILSQDSPALLALQHKKKYLADRLTTLIALQSTLKGTSKQGDRSSKEVEIEGIMFHGNVTIFDHNLSELNKLELVRTLDREWDEVVRAATGSVGKKSIISILSAAEPTQDEFSDKLGQFTVDSHSRKIYTKQGDSTNYQVNEFGDLVPLKDTETCVFFYDDCGRYFINDDGLRVYKANSTASEYVVGDGNVLIKSKEVRDGIEYHFDMLGRYYVDEKTKRKIYKETDSSSEYEEDGLGNLIRLGHTLQYNSPCDEVKLCTEESKQLRGAVGRALRVSLAEVVMLQPEKPIKYLGHRLLHYVKDQERQIKKRKEEEEMMVEREIRIAEEKELERQRQEAMEAELRMLALQSLEGSEMTYYTDSNLLNYKTNY